MKNAETTIYLMQTALKFDWTQCLCAMDYLMDLNTFMAPNAAALNKDDYFYKISRDTKTIILTAFLHYSELVIKAQVAANNFNATAGL